MTLSPSSLNFGNQNVGTTSASKKATLTNSGPLALNISSIVASGDFSQTNTCPVRGSLAAGSICVISVTFTPSTVGTRNGALTITDNASGSPQTAALSGTGTQPAVMLAPTSLNFGNQTVGMTSTQQVSTLTNTGNGTLMITSIGLTGANKGNFAETNNCPASLAPGNSCSLTVTFTPSSTGPRTAAISIVDNAPGSPQLLPLSGIGVLPAVTFSPTSLTFPNQVVFTTSTAKTVTLTNTGLGILSITKVSVTGAFSQTNTCGSQVAAEGVAHLV